MEVKSFGGGLVGQWYLSQVGQNVHYLPVIYNS